MHRARCACTPTRTAHAHLINTIPPNVSRDLQFASTELHIAIAASFFVELMRAIAFTTICTVFYMAIGNLECVAPDQNSGSWATQSRFLLDFAYNYARTCDFDRLCVGITICGV